MEMAGKSREGEVKPPMLSKDEEAEGTGGRFKFNADAQEFVPSSFCSNVAPQQSSTVPGYFYPCIQFFGNGSAAGLGPEWFYLPEQEPLHFLPDLHSKVPGSSKNGGDVIQKIVKQVEYQFSDSNLVASDFLMKIMNKDPEGYVPMSVIASWKKIKSLGVNNHMIIKALRTSTKLDVSEDGKKVRRKHIFTEREKEELQSRTVLVENLPENSSRQNLEKLFSVAGRVKNVRICHPQEPNAARSSKTDVLISNKLHAFVEFESIDQAEKAVEKLNDERNWRKGLRIRTLLRCSPRSVIRNKRADYDQFDVNSEDDQSPSSQTSGSPRIEQLLDHNVEDSLNGNKKGWGRGRAKSHVFVQSHGGRGILSQCPRSPSLGQCEASGKQTPQGPRMPDGTRGFTMGRGKPLMSSPMLGRSPLAASGLASSIHI